MIMGRNKKHRIRTIDGKALYLSPGLYELNNSFPCPYPVSGYFPAGTRLVVGRQLDKIGAQNTYEYFSSRLVGNKNYLANSYQTKDWNAADSRLLAITDDLGTFVGDGEVPPLFILDQLEQTGRITREDMRRALETSFIKK